MPSFTFVSTANAFVLRGATPVFVDVRPDTLNLDEALLERAITERTKAIVPVHYAGVACDMDAIMEVADRHGLVVIEDAAHALLADTGPPAGGIGQLGTLSFHETKNVICGEGGALLVNDPALVERAEILQEKGTNRSQFYRGQVDKYTWMDVGSSFLLSDINAAFLYAQLEQADWMTERRAGAVERRTTRRWRSSKPRAYVRRPGRAGRREPQRAPVLPTDRDGSQRDDLIERLARQGISCVFHYVPLHSSPAGRRFGRAGTDMPVTDDASGRLLRLPLWVGMDEAQVERVVSEIRRALLGSTRAPEATPGAAPGGTQAPLRGTRGDF